MQRKSTRPACPRNKPNHSALRKPLSLQIEIAVGDFKLDFSGPLADKIVSITEGFTGADLESTVRDLAYREIANDGFQMTEANIIDAFNNVVPLSQTSPEKIEAIRDWGKERAVPASGKPIGGEELQQKSDKPRTRKVLV